MYRSQSHHRREFLMTAGKAAGLVLFANSLSVPQLFAKVDEDNRSHGKGWGKGSRSGLPWHSGGYKVKDGFDVWRGRPLDVSQTFCLKNTWEEIESQGKVQDAWSVDIPEMLSISLAICPKNDNPKNSGARWWKDAAAGKMDPRWQKIANALKDRFKPDVILRLGWEFNHRSFPWYVGVCENPEQRQWYKDAWKRMVDIYRKTLGDKIKIDWCIVHESSFTWCPVTEFYPGNDHVDVIGIDYYDQWPSNKTEEAWNKNSRSKGKKMGIQTWMDFVKSNGKPISVPEWGVVNQEVTKKPREQGQDNPLFIEKMFDFFKTNAADMAYECYFNTSGHSKLGHQLFPEKQTTVPKSSQKYRELWKAG